METQTENTKVITENQEKSGYIECPMCQKQISNEVEVCPNCGYPIGSEIEKISVYEDMENKKSEEWEIVSAGHSAVSALCKVSSVLIGTIILIVGIYGIIETYMILPSICLLVGGFLFCLFLYALGELVKKATETSNYAHMIYNKITKK